MSSKNSLPRTVVDETLTDPVEKARAELKAALAAIEEKVNIPKRLDAASERMSKKFRAFARTNTVAATVIVVGAALAVGVSISAFVLLSTRRQG